MNQNITCKIEELVSQMTLEEKVALCDGGGAFKTAAIERLGIPSIFFSDGPHGLRKQINDGGLAEAYNTVEAVCFPSACATASSFDRELLKEMGAALGEECRAEEIAVLLGPGANIKRSPLCGRNFEYFSEDPYLSSQMAAGWIEGVQSTGTGASLKHFVANNQETRRMSVSADVDERTMREIYYASFETAVKEAKPATIMASYNRLNGIYTTENPDVLQTVLRDDWGFEGLVMSDWGAVNERVEALKAGLDLEMPSSKGIGESKLLAAVQSGVLPVKVLDRAVSRILALVSNWQERRNSKPYDKETHHELARRIESESMVLLKNEDSILPLKEGGKYAFIGEYAKNPRLQGGGSSHINCFKIDNALEFARNNNGISYSRGFDSKTGEASHEMIKDATQTAASADAAVIFVGLPDRIESEGFDRKSLDLPDGQNELIKAVTAVQPNTIVVIHNGAPVVMPWVGEVKGLIETYIGGQAVGSAVCDVLFGKVNPSGKLAETFPLKLEDTPAYLNFPGQNDKVNYAEGVFVGYRYYDKKKMDVLFPFGFGLSYTQFEYEGLHLSSDSIRDTDELEVNVNVKNIGSCTGKEVVQLYVTDHQEEVCRPEKELKGFQKIELCPGEMRQVTFVLNKRAFAYWETSNSDWQVQSGLFTISVGSSSRNLPLTADIFVEATTSPLRHYSMNSTLGDILKNPAGSAMLQPIVDGIMERFASADPDSGETFIMSLPKETALEMINNVPLRGLVAHIPGATTESFEQLIANISE